uniref:Uncharacterized protein n=1 Tax=Pyxicephalus adspersus TaxID=30357 RepID=A0AAV3A247_PYXAD|nr:TPA: hypothetical protein GDO54_014895 [Pyxicephalus adspersus]
MYIRHGIPVGLCEYVVLFRYWLLQVASFNFFRDHLGRFPPVDLKKGATSQSAPVSRGGHRFGKGLFCVTWLSSPAKPITLPLTLSFGH